MASFCPHDQTKVEAGQRGTTNSNLSFSSKGAKQPPFFSFSRNFTPHKKGLCKPAFPSHSQIPLSAPRHLLLLSPCSTFTSSASRRTVIVTYSSQWHRHQQRARQRECCYQVSRFPSHLNRVFRSNRNSSLGWNVSSWRLHLIFSCWVRVAYRLFFLFFCHRCWIFISHSNSAKYER